MTWGNVQVYVTSYLRRFNPSLSSTDTFLIPTLTLFSLCPFSLLGGKLHLLIGPKLYSFPSTCLLGLLVHFFALMLSSFAHTFLQFVFTYGLMSGIGVGIAVSPTQFAPTYMACWSDFRTHRGRVTAALSASFGVSSGLFALLSTLIVNPRYEDPTVLGVDGRLYYDGEVAERVPLLLRTLAGLYLVLGLAGVVMLSEVPPSVFHFKHRPPKFYITTQQFCKLPIAMVLCYSFTIYVTCSLKGSLYQRFDGTDIDHRLSFAYFIGGIACAIGRVSFGETFQKVNFKVTYSALLFAQALLAFTFIDLVSGYYTYYLWIAGVMVVEGSHFALLPSTCTSFLSER